MVTLLKSVEPPPPHATDQQTEQASSELKQRREITAIPRAGNKKCPRDRMSIAECVPLVGRMAVIIQRLHQQCSRKLEASPGFSRPLANSIQG